MTRPDNVIPLRPSYGDAVEQQRLAQAYARIAEPPRDFAEPHRFVRPMSGEQIARAMGEPPETVAEYLRHDEKRRIEALCADIVEQDRQERIERWQRRVAWFCILLAYALILYFTWQFSR